MHGDIRGGRQRGGLLHRADWFSLIFIRLLSPRKAISNQRLVFLSSKDVLLIVRLGH